MVCYGGGDEPLKVYLRKITETGISVISDIPREVLNPVLDASHDADCRREIMRHLRECLSESSGKRWPRIINGLTLIEKLMQQGSPALAIEIAHGHHFDLIQKVSFLEQFDAAARGCSDKRAQTTVRSKASALRIELSARLRCASSEELPQNAGLYIKDTTSTCSLGAISTTSTGSTAASSSAIRQSGGGGTGNSSPEEGHEVAAGDFCSQSLQIEEELRRITESGIVDIPQDRFTPVIAASHDADRRQVIVEHLLGCFSEHEGRQWRHVHAALLIVESLAKDGSSLTFSEAALGPDTNLAEQVRLLERFAYPSDWRAEKLVRRKARSLRSKLREWLPKSDASEGVVQMEDAFSTLRAWAESEEASPSSGSSSEVESGSDSDGLVPHARRPPPRRGILAAMAARPRGNPFVASSDKAQPVGSRASTAGKVDDSEDFFTPMQTPAMAVAPARAKCLLSL
mmetsp:Transcript_137432/g.293712  ORF Transcript_137432/g.293712 Transcript_137432/m.293712 type:complete len:458 (+) Transcript_137432:75-1448(+)